MSRVISDEPDLIIKAPINFERNHVIPECPQCQTPNPSIVFVMTVAPRTVATYRCSNDHSFAAHHNAFNDADNLKIFKHEKPKLYNYICDNCYAVYTEEVISCRKCGKGKDKIRRELRYFFKEWEQE